MPTILHQGILYACTAADVDEIVLDGQGGQGGRVLTLRRVARRDVEGCWSYEATLTLPNAQGTTEVVDHGDWLGPFFRELAEAWNGFDGTKEYGSLEGQMHLSCTHDGLGTVACVVTLGQPWPPVWHIEGVLEFGAGAHLESVASDVQAFVAASA